MSHGHGFTCECGESFDSLSELEEHVDEAVGHGPRIRDALDDKGWELLEAKYHRDNGEIWYIDLARDTYRGADLKVGGETVRSLWDVGYQPTAWLPEPSDDGVDMRVWLEEMEGDDD